MRVVVLGASRFGVAIAEHLIADAHEVVLIEKDRARLERLADRLDCGMIEGDGTLPTIQREAYRDENDVFIAVTNASDDNILASLVARSVGFGRVIPQIVSSELMAVCKELDLTDVINPHATVAESICGGLEDDAAVAPEALLQNELALKRVIVTGAQAGKTVGDLSLPDEARAIALVRDEKESFASGETELKQDDELIFLLKRGDTEALDGCFETKE
jgi:trk system potassium uptake protein TrkA